MAEEVEVEYSRVFDLCATTKAEGNAAYGAGDLGLATSHYERALEHWEEAVRISPQPKAFEVGQLVRYDTRNFFGVVMSCFPLFDEYFLKDLGSDKAIWVGDAGGDLRRFARQELHAVRREELDFRQAVAQNLAAAYLRREVYEKCILWADAALVIEGRAPKALLRKGAALLRLNQPGPASDVLATCAEVTPKDAEVRRLLKEAEAKRSPTWVCATGCCGPWGIVCGNPVTSGANAIVVAPAEKKPAASASNSGTSTPSTTVPPMGEIGPGFKLATCSQSECSSDCHSDDNDEAENGGADANAASEQEMVEQPDQAKSQAPFAEPMTATGPELRLGEAHNWTEAPVPALAGTMRWSGPVFVALLVLLLAVLAARLLSGGPRT